LRKVVKKPFAHLKGRKACLGKERKGLRKGSPVERGKCRKNILLIRETGRGTLPLGEGGDVSFPGGGKGLLCLEAGFLLKEKIKYQSCKGRCSLARKLQSRKINSERVFTERGLWRRRSSSLGNRRSLPGLKNLTYD